MKQFLLVVLLWLSCLNLQAQNHLSAFISYQTLPGDQLQISFNILTGLGDSSLSAGTLDASLQCANGGKLFTLSPALLQRKRIVQSCDSTKNPWHHIFVTEVDLNDTALAGLKSCCTLRINLTVCCRDSSVSTVHNGHKRNLYVYTEFQYCGVVKNRNNVTLSHAAPILACNNQPYSHQLGITSSEYDSISYEVAPALIEFTKEVQYNTGYHADLPLKAYFGTKSYPYANPNNSPPLGFFVDSTTSNIIFTPTKVMTSSVALQVKEWRRNVLNIYQLVGITHIELAAEIVDCPLNNPPSVSGVFRHEACAGEQLCFDLTTYDKSLTPPPPAPAPMPDSVTIRWNRGISDASFSVINPKALHQTGRFCWTPKASDAGPLPHSFVVTARDNACPRNAEVRRSVLIYVGIKENAIVKKQPLGTGLYQYEILDTSGKPASFSYQIALKDLQGNAIHSSNAYFRKSGTSIANSTDTLILLTPGVYVVEFIDRNTSGKCQFQHLDTIYFQVSSVEDFAFGRLSFFPNPAFDVINIQNPVDELYIFSNDGKLLLEARSVNTLSIKSLSPGIYHAIGYVKAGVLRGTFVVH